MIGDASREAAEQGLGFLPRARCRRRHGRQLLTSRDHRILTPRQCGNECAEIGIARDKGIHGEEQPRRARRDAKVSVVGSFSVSIRGLVGCRDGSFNFASFGGLRGSIALDWDAEYFSNTWIGLSRLSGRRRPKWRVSLLHDVTEQGVRSTSVTSGSAQRVAVRADSPDRAGIPRTELRSGFSWVHAIAIQVRQATQVLAAYFRISSKIFQVRLKSKLFFSTFRMTNEMQIWIDRHRVGISRKEAQLRQISDLFFRNPPPTNRLSNLISRQRVV